MRVRKAEILSFCEQSPSGGGGCTLYARYDVIGDLTGEVWYLVRVRENRTSWQISNRGRMRCRITHGWTFPRAQAWFVKIPFKALLSVPSAQDLGPLAGLATDRPEGLEAATNIDLFQTICHQFPCAFSKGELAPVTSGRPSPTATSFVNARESTAASFDNLSWGLTKKRRNTGAKSIHVGVIFGPNGG